VNRWIDTSKLTISIRMVSSTAIGVEGRRAENIAVTSSVASDADRPAAAGSVDVDAAVSWSPSSRRR
jgi:hypothetical protein